MTKTHKGTADATDASPGLPDALTPQELAKTGRRKRPPGKPRSHRDMPTDPQAQGEYVAGQFRDQAEKVAAAEKRASNPDHETGPEFEARRSRTLYSLGQLDVEQVAAIEVDYRAGIKPVAQLCADHGIVKSTLYALAERRSWPLRSEIQRAMADAISDVAAAAVAVELRTRAGGESSSSPGLSALVDAAAELLPADQRGQPGNGEPLTQRTLDDMAQQDTFIQAYGIAAGAVLAKHRQMAESAVSACDSLITLQRDAIARAQEKARDMLHDPAMMAKHLDPLVKLLSSTVTTMQRTIEMQRQAWAMDASSGKGLPLHELLRHRAVMAAGGAPDALPPPAGQDSGEAQEPISLPAGMGSYEDLVRESERRGERLA